MNSIAGRGDGGGGGGISLYIHSLLQYKTIGIGIVVVY